MRFFPRIFGKNAGERAAWFRGLIQRAAWQTELRQNAVFSARSFDTAETTPWTESWPMHTAPINEVLSRQLSVLRARSRGLARNNEWAIGYLIQLKDNVLGDAGIPLQVRLTAPDGCPEKKASAALEAAWARWGHSADVSGLGWNEVEALALRILAVDGELLYRLRPGAGPMRFSIQLLDPELLDVSLSRAWGGNRIRMGVEIDDDGCPVAYWLRMSKTGDAPSEYLSVGQHTRLPASEVRHFFIRSEPGQRRGIPWLTGGARRLWLLKDFEEAAAVASSNAAKRQGFFVSPTGEAPSGFADTFISSALSAAKASGKTLTAEEMRELNAAAEKFTTTVPGQYDTLPLGYTFQPYESRWPDIGAETYAKQQLRGWAAAMGASYVTLGNDLESVNYSSARVGILSEREHFKSIQALLIRALHLPVITAALPCLILSEPRLKLSRLADYQNALTWQPRRWAGIDPVKEANANQINITLGLTSRRRVILERGDDPDEIAEEIAAEKALWGSAAPPETPEEEGGGDEKSKIFA
ncbi:MAG: phage portal protein [Candidatus Accumulibacter sp.]|jgi:lambda family phage portal protein|nr:phage portal protein [Accumulibacter sp.]